MSIRIRNLDLATAGMKKVTGVSLGDFSGNIDKTIFVAPVDCRIDTVDLYSGQGVSGTSQSAQITVYVRDAAANSSVLQSRGTSATGGTTNDIVANTQYRLTPSSIYDLTQGTVIEMNFSGSGALSAVFVQTTYTQLLHKNTR